MGRGSSQKKIPPPQTICLLLFSCSPVTHLLHSSHSPHYSNPSRRHLDRTAVDELLPRPRRPGTSSPSRNSTAIDELFPPPFHLYLTPPNHHRRGNYGRRRAASSPTTSLAASPVYLITIHISLAPSTYLAPSTFQSPLSNPNHRRIWAIAEYLPLDLQHRRQGFTALGLLPV